MPSFPRRRESMHSSRAAAWVPAFAGMWVPAFAGTRLARCACEPRFLAARGAGRLRDPGARRHDALAPLFAVAAQCRQRGGMEPRGARRRRPARRRGVGGAAQGGQQRRQRRRGPHPVDDARGALRRAEYEPRSPQRLGAAAVHTSAGQRRRVVSRRFGRAALDRAVDGEARAQGAQVSGGASMADRRLHALARAIGGFTLVELLIALVLMALISALLFGSLKVAGRSSDAGDAKAEATASMRLASDFLRTEIEEQHPQRMRHIAEFPLLFSGAPDQLEFAAPVPSRIQGGGVWLYRLRVATDGDKSTLVLDRMVPDVNAQALPQFTGNDRSVLADDITDIKLQYFGRDDGADASVAPTWRDRWDSRQTLPLEIRIDVTPARGSAWPTIYASPRNA